MNQATILKKGCSMQTFYLCEKYVSGESLTPIHFSRPYTAEARRFARLFWATYREEMSMTKMARELGMPRTTLQYWIKPK